MPANAKKVTCPDCRGSGFRYAQGGFQPCPRCEGRGEILAPAPAEETPATLRTKPDAPKTPEEED